MSDDIIAKIIEVIRKSSVVCLTTTDGVIPRARYIQVRDIDEDLTLTCATGMADRKTVHIRKNPHVHIIAGYPPPEKGMPNVSIDAVATIYADQPNREKYWEESFHEHFSGPDDENYIILKLHPTRAWLSTGEEITDFPKAKNSQKEKS